MASWIAACAAPLVRPLVFPRRQTRIPRSATEVDFDRNGTTLRGWVTNPQAARAIIYFGGNAAQVGDSRKAFETNLPDYAVYLIAYRGYGASDGRPSEKVLVADGCALFDDVSRKHRGHDVAIWGRSLGSGVASQVAARRPAASRLILVTPFDSAADVARDHSGRLPIAALMVDRFDSARIADRIEAPTLVLRAGQDRVVLPERTDRLVRALPLGTEVIDFPDADHASISESEPGYWPAVHRFLG